MMWVTTSPVGCQCCSEECAFSSRLTESQADHMTLTQTIRSHGALLPSEGRERQFAPLRLIAQAYGGVMCAQQSVKVSVYFYQSDVLGNFASGQYSEVYGSPYDEHDPTPRTDSSRGKRGSGMTRTSPTLAPLRHEALHHRFSLLAWTPA